MRSAETLVAALLTVALSTPAFAHAVGLSRGEYASTSDGARAEMTFARAELHAAAAHLGSDAKAESLGTFVSGGVQLHTSGRPCAATLVSARVIERDGLSVTMAFACPAPLETLTLRMPLLEALPNGHRHLAHFYDAAQPEDISVVLHRDHSQASWKWEPRESSAAPAARASWAWVWTGVRHILEGYDHLLFLLGLLLTASGLTQTIKALSAFTVGHCLSLAAATFGVWTPDPNWVEPLIALSVAYVGLVSLMRRTFSHGWLVALAFGLVHGLGFAGALEGLRLSDASLLTALLSFNFGVELGQLAVLALLFPLLMWATRLRRPAAACVLASGVVILAARIAGLAGMEVPL
jgi:hypothetical protein